jgi:hypothetical protein
MMLACWRKLCLAEEIQIEFPESGPSRAGQHADDLTSRIRELDETATVAISARVL